MTHPQIDPLFGEILYLERCLEIEILTLCLGLWHSLQEQHLFLSAHYAVIVTTEYPIQCCHIDQLK